MPRRDDLLLPIGYVRKALDVLPRLVHNIESEQGWGMRFDRVRSFGSRLLMAISAAILVGSYQNCAQTGSEPPVDTSADDNHIVRAMEDAASGRDITAVPSTEIQSQKIADACRPEQVHCIRKVYSPVEDDRESAEVICTESSGHCFDVSTVFYNTVFALQQCENCGPESARPGGEYNREEYTCWVGKPAAGAAAAYALRSDFDAAVSAALEACGGSIQ